MNKNRNRPVTFVPNIFKVDTSKPSIVAASDPFLTDDAGQEYCSLLSKRENKLPNFLHQFETFTDNVLDISDDVLEDIAKMHMEREKKFKEDERKEEEYLAQQKAAEMKVKVNLDKRVNKIMKTHNHYVKRSCPVKIPFKSTLSHEEHEFYLRAFIKYQIRPPCNSLEEREYEQYMSMQNKVFNEQSCLMNFSHRVSQLVLKDYNSVPNVMENYIRDYFSHRCQRSLSYPGLYKSEVDIPLKPQVSKATPDTFQMKHVGHLLSLGRLHWLKIPNPHVNTVLSKQDSVSSKINPDCDEDFDRSQYLYKCPVSSDPNAEFLAKQHNASIVISASAFKMMVDNQEAPFDKEWNIPVRIKSHTTKDKSGKERSQRVVYIDKPLPRKSWYPLQKKFTFFKAAAKAELTKFVPQPCFKMRRPEMTVGPKPLIYDDIFGDLTTEESFGSDSDFGGKSDSPFRKSAARNRKRKKSPEPKDYLESDLHLSEDDDQEVLRSPVKAAKIMYPPPSTYHSKDSAKERPKKNASPSPHSTPPSKQGARRTSKGDAGGDFLDDLLTKQSSFLKPQTAAGSSKEALPVPPNLSTYENKEDNSKRFHSKPWSHSLKTEWNNYQLKDCPDGSGHNVHYQLFTFETTEATPLKSKRDEPLTILVRHNIHGLSRFKKEPKKTKAFVLYPKLENQVHFGCEVNSLSEIVQQWATLVIRPNTSLLQIRLCIESGSVVMTDEKTLESVLKEGKLSHLQFNQQSVFATLNGIFSVLVKMSSGDYFLHHSPKTEAFIKLYKTVDSDSSIYQNQFDLHKYYSDGAVTSWQYKMAPWLAIDTHIITPFHMLHKKIPATFPMENSRKLDRNERKRKRASANKKLSIEGYE